MLLIFISSKPVSLQFATCRHSGAFNGQDVGKRSDSRLTVGWESFQGKAASKACARKVGQCDHNGDVLGCLHDIVMVVIVFVWFQGQSLSLLSICRHFKYTFTRTGDTKASKGGIFTTLTIVSLADNHKYYSQHFFMQSIDPKCCRKVVVSKTIGRLRSAVESCFIGAYLQVISLFLLCWVHQTKLHVIDEIRFRQFGWSFMGRWTDNIFIIASGTLMSTSFQNNQ